MLKKGTRVMTPHGGGFIVGTDPATRSIPPYRYIVELDDRSVFNFSPAYWPKEVTKLSEPN